MAIILEQDSINHLVELAAKQAKVEVAKEKVGVVYESATGMEMESALSTLQEISEVIGLIEGFIKPSNEYKVDFDRLQVSYNRKILKYK